MAWPWPPPPAPRRAWLDRFVSPGGGRKRVRRRATAACLLRRERFLLLDLARWLAARAAVSRRRTQLRCPAVPAGHHHRPALTPTALTAYKKGPRGTPELHDPHSELHNPVPLLSELPSAATGTA